MRLNGFVYPAYSKGGHNAEVRIPCFATQASPFPPHIWDKNSNKQMLTSICQHLADSICGLEGANLLSDFATAVI